VLVGAAALPSFASAQSLFEEASRPGLRRVALYQIVPRQSGIEARLDEPTADWIYLATEPCLKTSDIATVRAVATDGPPYIDVELTSQAAARFAVFTAQHIGTDVGFQVERRVDFLDTRTTLKEVLTIRSPVVGRLQLFLEPEKLTSAPLRFKDGNFLESYEDAVAFAREVQALADAIHETQRLAYERGVAAIPQRKWTDAVDALQQAVASGLESPEILYNLALAHSQAGHPVAAVVYLRAYEVVQPGAPNSEPVNREIARLKRVIEKLQSDIFSMARTAAEGFPSSDDRWKHRKAVSLALADGGRLEEAITFLDRDGARDARDHDYLRARFALAAAQSGDPDTADRVLSHLETPAGERGRQLIVGNLDIGPESLGEVIDAAWNATGSQYCRRGRTATAIQAFANIIDRAKPRGDVELELDKSLGRPAECPDPFFGPSVLHQWLNLGDYGLRVRNGEIQDLPQALRHATEEHHDAPQAIPEDLAHIGALIGRELLEIKGLESLA